MLTSCSCFGSQKLWTCRVALSLLGGLVSSKTVLLPLWPVVLDLPPPLLVEVLVPPPEEVVVAVAPPPSVALE